MNDLKAMADDEFEGVGFEPPPVDARSEGFSQL
jgi:hypothetical protein